jgi:pimeloyl-ACP methyl ester carboxylesterase
MAQIIFNDKKIFYRVEGAGRPVLLLHGFAEDGNIWNRQLDKLKQNYLLIIPDLPGSGQSEMLDRKCTLEDYAEVVKAIVDKEIKSEKSLPAGQGLVAMIGHSMGGYITLAFAEKYPQLLSAFGLFHSSAYADSEEKIQTRKKAIEFIKKNGKEEFLKTSVPGLFSEKTQQERPELIEELLALANKITPGALIQYYEAMILRPDRTHILKSFSRPVLFIIGKNDTAVPVQDSLEQSHLPQISYVHILENSAHEGMWEEEELAFKYLSEFLREITG